MRITQDQLEQLSLDWFREMGWEYANGVDISPDGDAPERDDYRVVVLKDRVAEAVARLNADLLQSASLMSYTSSPISIIPSCNKHERRIDSTPIASKLIPKSADND